MDFEKVLELIKAMNREQVVYKLFGALALSAPGSSQTDRRATFRRSTFSIFGWMKKSASSVARTKPCDAPIRVVTPRMLYEMKRDTVRYKDKIDAEALRQKFGWES